MLGPRGEDPEGVLKVGHHGSSNSASAQFLEAVGADFMIISVGRNSYGHPAPDNVGGCSSRALSAAHGHSGSCKSCLASLAAQDDCK